MTSTMEPSVATASDEADETTPQRSQPSQAKRSQVGLGFNRFVVVAGAACTLAVLCYGVFVEKTGMSLTFVSLGYATLAGHHYRYASSRQVGTAAMAAVLVNLIVAPAYLYVVIRSPETQWPTYVDAVAGLALLALAAWSFHAERSPDRRSPVDSAAAALSPLYSEHLDVLIALSTYLAFTHHRSRTPSGIARDLDLGKEARLRETLDGFPALFRRSANIHLESGEHYYNLHAKYALRGSSAQQEPLPADFATTILQFIAQRADAEVAARAAQDHMEATRRDTSKARTASYAAAILAAVATVTTSVLAAIIAN